MPIVFLKIIPIQNSFLKITSIQDPFLKITSIQDSFLKITPIQDSFLIDQVIFIHNIFAGLHMLLTLGLRFV